MESFEFEGVTLIHADARTIDLPEDIAAVCTDPPYGISNNSDYSRFTSKSKNWGKQIVGDNEPFSPDWLLDYPKVCLWGFQYFATSLPIGSTLVWIKKPEKAMGTFLSDAELAWVKKGVGVYCFPHVWNGYHRASEKGKSLHPNQKPIALWEWVFDRMKLQPGELVFDPYMGSGSCAVAANRKGLRYLGVEIDAAHYRTAVERFSEKIPTCYPRYK